MATVAEEGMGGCICVITYRYALFSKWNGEIWTGLQSKAWVLLLRCAMLSQRSFKKGPSQDVDLG